MFHNADAENRALYFNTLSEPAAKSLRHLSQFSFFDPARIESEEVQFLDLSGIWRQNDLEASTRFVLDHVKENQPSLIVIDSFRVFNDLARSNRDMRKFVYELVVNLMAWEATTLLLGEFGPEDIDTNPLFSIIDGLFLMSQREQSGEEQRFLQLVKMRGTNHDRNEHSFQITEEGIAVFAPRATIRRQDDVESAVVERLKTGIPSFDALLDDGIPRGSSLLVGGAAGTGKTLLMLEFLYRGALMGEKGILFTFEETKDHLRAAARGIGFDFDAQLERGMIEMVFIPHPDIALEEHMLLIQERVNAMPADRVVFDSLTVFLQKIHQADRVREKVFQVASIIQNARAVAFMATDIPYGGGKLSHFGMEEAVVDGVILLTLEEVGLERRRYLELYKLRNTAHSMGRHGMTIAQGGIQISPPANGSKPG